MGMLQGLRDYFDSIRIEKKIPLTVVGFAILVGLGVGGASYFATSGQINELAEERLAFRPGQSWSYSNSGFLLAGAVIEGATGDDYFEHVKVNLYEPAGMVNTDCYEMDRPVPNLAIGYSSWDTPAVVAELRQWLPRTKLDLG